MRQRRGVVLLAVLIVVAILMLVGYQFYNLMAAEYEAVHASNRVANARVIADSGLHYAAFVLSYPQSVGLADADDSNVVSPVSSYHNPSVFQRRPVTSFDPRFQGYFAIVAPRDSEDPLASSSSLRFGVEDESAKINLMSLLQIAGNARTARNLLMALPNMTEETANSLMSWMQASGGESANTDAQFYASMGYALKAGRYESFEELLLVRGVTPRMLLGNDLNRNSFLEPEEDDGSGFLDRGWSRYLTIYSREPNTDYQGQPRVYLNDSSNLSSLWENLNTVVGPDLANFILAYRIYGPVEEEEEAGGAGGGNSNNRGRDNRGGNGGGGGGGGSNNNVVYGELTKEDLDLSRTNANRLESIFDLIDAEVEIQKEGEEEATRYRSPLRRDDVEGLRDFLPLLLDKTSTSDQTELPARININTAPREILMGLPDLDETAVQNILDHRPTQDSDPALASIYRTPAWLVTEAGFQPSVVGELEPYITTRSQVFRVQAVGYYEQGGSMARLEAVIDTNNGRPRFLYWRDLTELGRGYDPRLLSVGGP